MNRWDTVGEIKDMVGLTMKSVTQNGQQMFFESEDGRRFEFFHDQDCCESVAIESVDGDLNDLVGSPLVMAEEVSSEGAPRPNGADWGGSYTWTFYKFATNKGYVTVRWLGESNGYYSESVSFTEHK